MVGGLGATPLGGSGDPLSSLLGLLPAVGRAVGVSPGVFPWEDGPTQGEVVPA